MADDLEQARAFQRALLPTPPPFGPLEAAVLYVPADQVGGDLYDVHLGPAGQLRIFLGDATGHGVQAAMRTMVAKAVYERHKLSSVEPDELLGRISAELCALAIKPHMWMPACCLDIALPSRPGGPMPIRYANAAHLPIYVLRPGAPPREVEASGTFLGLCPDVAFPSADLELRPGERLLAYTDGLIEQWSPTGQSLPIDELHARLARGPLAEAVAAALSWSAQFRGPTQPQLDDITLLGIEYRIP
jgi:serine phosphatase RsbU (regulator of sigma subunit)